MSEGNHQHSPVDVETALIQAKIDVQIEEQDVISTRDAGVRSVIYSREHSLVIFAAWDSTLNVHHGSPDAER